MKVCDLVALYERRRAEAEEHGSMGPLAVVYGLVLADLRALDDREMPDRMMDTAEAAAIRGVAPKTVARWAAQGRFPGAQKTSAWGEWRIPASAVYAFGEAGSSAGESLPKLWVEP